MCRCACLGGEHVSDGPFFVDYETYTTGEQSECFLDSVGLPDRAVRIAEQYEWQVMLFREVSMRDLAVGAYSNNLCAEIPEGFV